MIMAKERETCPMSPEESDDPKEAEALVNVADLSDPNIDFKGAIAGALEDDSPYPEVRSAVANTDDPNMPVSTVRVWVIGLMMTVLLAGLSQFFSFRYPSVTISPYIAILISLPLGRAWAAVAPKWHVFGVPLNPGPFNIKEHVLLTTIGTITSPASQYAMDTIAVQRLYYNQEYNFSYQWMLVMSSQLMAFSLCGVLQHILVEPSSMIWPARLVSCTLFNTLHATSYAGMGSRGGISRGRFYLYAWIAGMCWYFLPGYLFQGLSYFSWVCWIAPDNIPVNQLFGYVHGLGMSLITFDWAQISYIGSPLATPWWVEANVAVGFVFFVGFLYPYSTIPTPGTVNTCRGISSLNSYDNTGHIYNVSRIINADATFNLTAYERYSPIFLPTTLAMSYGLSLASIAAAMTHAFLFLRKQILSQFKPSMREQPDIHARLMSKYRRVPEWWYGTIFVSMVVFGIVVIEVWHTEFPVWAFFLSLAIAFVSVIPVGMIQAVTNQEVALSIITELIVGYILPGRPIAMMLFKTWGFITMVEALYYTSEFKLGHYMKIPPRLMFWAQFIAIIVSGTVQLGVQAWAFTHIEDLCSPKQKDGFICPNVEVFGTASIVWGVIGPMRVFSPGQIYSGLMYFFLIGAICPVIAWLIHLKWPNSFIRYVNVPVVFSGLRAIPPANAVNFVPWAIVGFIFNFYIRRRYFSWWTKYNYVLSAAMDSGVAFSIVIIFFALQYPLNGSIGANTVQKWWGNMVYLNTADGKALPYKTASAGKTFGPKSW